jgi:hypothetical protein
MRSLICSALCAVAFLFVVCICALSVGNLFKSMIRQNNDVWKIIDGKNVNCSALTKNQFIASGCHAYGETWNVRGTLLDK